MKRTVRRLYNRWRALNDQGLVENTYEGYGKNKRAGAIGLLIAAAPMLPLMLSDVGGLKRGWPWYAWAVVAVTWGIGILGLTSYETGKTAFRYYRDWWTSRRR